jgi:phosphatidylserine/phosphatidylglycerophosphate/cardiolipin synthase-like enzyme
MYSVLTRETLFADLVEEIKKAKNRIIINAYIWINDEIGREVATAVLEAAEKGVKVYIRKDLSGSIFEHTPGRIPFFAKIEEMQGKWFQIWNSKYSFMTPKNLNWVAFHVYGKKNRPEIGHNPLLERMSRHQNIWIDNLPLYNHGKLMVIDDVVYVGGQCISNDYTKWKDYNIKISNRNFTEEVIKKICEKGDENSKGDLQLIQNTFSQKKSIFHHYETFIKEIEKNEELIIEMAYLGMWFYPILEKAIDKGVKVTIITSKEADTNHHTNMEFLSNLIANKGEKVNVFLSDDMIHTKGLVTPGKVILGAANFHGACGYFKAVNEQSVFSRNRQLAAHIMFLFKEDMRKSTEIHKTSNLPKWSKRKAMLEKLFVHGGSYLIYANKKSIQRWRNLVNQRIWG